MRGGVWTNLAISDSITRARLRRDKFERRRAVANFPLKVVLIAQNLQQLTLVGVGPLSPDLETYANQLELEIREIFIKTFGHDMIDERPPE
jgi:hypothetical protein